MSATNKRRSQQLATALRVKRRGPLLQVLKTAIAVIAAWYAAQWLVSTDTPVFAAIAAMLIVAPSVNQSLTRGIERTIGVVLGVLISSVLGAVFGVSGITILAACVLALCVGWAIRATPPTSNQIAISALLVLALGATSANYALDRILETVLGAIIGLAINALLVPPLQTEAARDQLRILRGEVAQALNRLAEALTAEQSQAQLQRLMIEARLLRPMRDNAIERIADADESLTMNPRRSKHHRELKQMRELLNDQLSPIVNRVVGMTRAVFDHYSDSLIDEPASAQIAEQLRRQAHDVRLAVFEADVNPEPMTSAIPALTAPLQIRPPKSENWILIGSLMEDQRRIREILLGEQL